MALHLAREFLWAFALTLGAFIAIYVIADFFDRFDTFLRHDASGGAIVRYFLFKIPLVVTQATPLAVLTGGIVGLGLLARQHEFVALRACGVSIWQMITPLLALAALISVAAFAWNESVVPYSAHRWHMIETVEIKKRALPTVFMGRDIWYHGRVGFYNIERVNAKRNALYGLRIYHLGTDFRPQRVVEVDTATWTDEGWQFAGARTRRLTPGGVELRHAPPPDPRPPAEGCRHLGELGGPPLEARPAGGEPVHDAHRRAARCQRDTLDERRRQRGRGHRPRVRLLRAHGVRSRARAEWSAVAHPCRVVSQRPLRAGGRLLRARGRRLARAEKRGIPPGVAPLRRRAPAPRGPSSRADRATG